jgi:hypothetical protein
VRTAAQLDLGNVQQKTAAALQIGRIQSGMNSVGCIKCCKMGCGEPTQHE